jgi:poly(beta-D-mannuronate) lyase
MKRLICSCSLLLSLCSFARTIPVRTAEELNAVNKTVQPGDTVVLQNGTWNNAVIKLTASGTEAKPIVFRAQTPGKVIISGVSQLRLGGNYLVIDGWYFTEGHTPGSSVIDFRVNDKQLANHCRVTNCVIDDFNQPKRMQEDYWVSFSGQHNRIDHCTFRNKKNLGVLVAVILDDDRSRTNFHEMDHNYFGVRPPLASNAGEIIRVGVSQHCQFNSNTQIHDNLFEQCDGETEIVSIKSCSNVVRNNLFKECQGDVVLRHGNYNTVVNNIFYGNRKEGTGGVRVINRGQWVANNFFYQCRGVGFRSPLSLMNGIPNSPANRYVQVTDAVVANNSFFQCSPISLCEGSDAERTLSPANVLFAKNIFDNETDSSIYKAFDRIDSIRFSENKVSKGLQQATIAGFERASFTTTNVNAVPIPSTGTGRDNAWIDSLQAIKGDRPFAFSGTPGFSGAALFRSIMVNADACGARWFSRAGKNAGAVRTVNCPNSLSLYSELTDQSTPLRIRLTGNSYTFDLPVLIQGNVTLTADAARKIKFATSGTMDAVFVLQGKGSLVLENLNLSSASINAGSLIATDTAGSSEHYNLALRNCSFDILNSCKQVFHARAATLADSIIVRNCRFNNFTGGLVLEDEKENKGYYNVEKMRVEKCSFLKGKATLLSLYRGGNDESTMGPDLLFANNNIEDCNAAGNQPLIYLTGVQKSNIRDNRFVRSNALKPLILYKDTVRASHLLANNLFSESGHIQQDEFVTEKNNQIK